MLACINGIVYPCSAVAWGVGQWLVSYGEHDERCCLRTIHWAQVSKVERIQVDT